jgi:hypothetical protein
LRVGNSDIGFATGAQCAVIYRAIDDQYVEARGGWLRRASGQEAGEYDSKEAQQISTPG